jgi:hypothetical protein
MVDSTSLEDDGDPEAVWGFFSGFKVHASVDQRGLRLQDQPQGGEAHRCQGRHSRQPKGRQESQEDEAQTHPQTIQVPSGAALQHPQRPPPQARMGEVEGLAKKSSLVYAASTAPLNRALEALLKGEDHLLRRVSTYRD